jgi:hypothetical protein
MELIRIVEIDISNWHFNCFRVKIYVICVVQYWIFEVERIFMKLVISGYILSQNDIKLLTSILRPILASFAWAYLWFQIILKTKLLTDA